MKSPRLPYRSECDCTCHTKPSMMHAHPCCEPDPEPEAPKDSAGRSGFITDQDPQAPYAFVQWKNTDVCMDFWCRCGAQCHFDGDFAYTVKCPHCGTVYEMPCYLFPRVADEKTYGFPDTDAKVMEPDEDYSDNAQFTDTKDTQDGHSTGSAAGTPPGTHFRADKIGRT